MEKILIAGFLLVIINAEIIAQIPVVKTGVDTRNVKEWIDADTGHRLRRLTASGKHRSFYFHNNPFIKSKNGLDDLMIYQSETDDGAWQFFALNLSTLESDQITVRPERKRGEIIGTQHREVFYQVQDSVFATNIDTKQERRVFVFPVDFKASITSLNADETMLAGTWADPKKSEILKNHPSKGEFFDRIFDAKLKHTLFAINIETGELQKIYSEDTWLGHIQFSTTDPEILMFCHEGPWHKVDRIWHVNLQNNHVEKIHTRTVHREIAGHEFWSWDGQTVYYDLQIPRGETFYLAAYDIQSHKMKKYPLERDEWSIHFNISHDQTLFCGDGGDPSQVAHAEDGMWIYLFTPNRDELDSKRLVNMQNHDYKFEPNVHFTPDGKWIIFRSNFDGSDQVYAVEVRPYKS